MRIDIDSVSYRPDFTPQKTSGDANELNNRGENVRGRVIDVNQNIVLIQTSTGKQFSASTVVPMENFIGQDMSFSVMIGPDGEIVLSPEIDESKRNNLEELKVQDMLVKLGKTLSADNKEIIKDMMKSSIPITKENFEQAKELKFALNILQSDDFAIDMEQSDLEQNISDVIKDIQNKKDFGVAKQSDTTIVPKDVSLKDVLLLKNLDLNISPKNINALSQVLNKLNTNSKEDLTGLIDVLNNKNIQNDIEADIQNINLSLNNKISDKKDSSHIQAFLDTFEDFSVEDMEILNKNSSNFMFEEFSDEDININKNISNDVQQLNLNSKDILEMLENVAKNINKKISEKKENRSEELSVDYEKAKDDIKTVINTLGKESELSKTLEKQVAPKLDILSSMLEKYNYNVIPFKTEQNYENTLQYFVKKDKKSLKKQDEINIGVSLDTKNYGNVKTMVNYNKNKTIKLDFITQDKKVKTLFDNNFAQLKSILKTIGFSNIDMKVTVQHENTTLLEDVVQNKDASRSFEYYI